MTPPTPGAESLSPGQDKAMPVRITMLYNNVAGDPRFLTAWGLACLVELDGARILFDTGGDGPTLAHNMDAAGIDPAGLDAVVLSHIHGDHTGGLGRILQLNPGMTVFLPTSFPDGFKRQAAEMGARIAPLDKPLKILPGIFSTGVMGAAPPEQAVAIHTPRGLAVVTGCAHPGIVRIVERIREIHPEPIHLVLGGFHLLQSPDREVEGIISRLKSLGVEKAAPSHCTGGRAMAAFAHAWKNDFIFFGCGHTLHIDHNVE